MGLFFSSDRFTRPGPGVRPDAPRKKGVARLAEIMGRDMWNFFRAGFLAFLGCLPFIIGMFFAVETHALLFMLLAGIIGGLIASTLLILILLPVFYRMVYGKEKKEKRKRIGKRRKPKNGATEAGNGKRTETEGQSSL